MGPEQEVGGGWGRGGEGSGMSKGCLEHRKGIEGCGENRGSLYIGSGERFFPRWLRPFLWSSVKGGTQPLPSNISHIKDPISDADEMATRPKGGIGEPWNSDVGGDWHPPITQPASPAVRPLPLLPTHPTTCILYCIQPGIKIA